MLHDLCERLQWDGRALRGYRCRVEYPIHNSEIVMAFELPAAP